MRTWKLAALACCLAATALAGRAAADEAEDAFQSLYGQDCRKAAAAASPRDSVVLAERILSAVETGAAGRPAMAAVMCQKAYDLAAKTPDGWATAVKAMEILQQKDPNRKILCLENIQAVQQKELAVETSDRKGEAGEALISTLLDLTDAQAQAKDFAGAIASCQRAKGAAAEIRSSNRPAVEARLKGLAELEKFQAGFVALKEAQAKDPNNVALRNRLARMCLVEQDDPAEALKVLGPDCQESLRIHAPLAAKPPGELAEGSLLELAEWYKKLADETPGSYARMEMLARTTRYYQEFLTKHAAADLDRGRVEMLLQKASADLDQLARDLGPALGTSGRWIDLLKLVDPKRDAVSGTWIMGRDGLQSDTAPMAAIRLPYQLPAEYDFKITFTRKTGADAVQQQCVSGGKPFDWNMGAASSRLCLLDMNPGRWIQDAPMSIEQGLDNGRRYTSVVQVRKTGIRTFLEGNLMLEWKLGAGPATRSSRPAALPRDWLGLGSVNSLTVFHKAELLAVSGRGKPVSRETKPADSPQ